MTDHADLGIIDLTAVSAPDIRVRLRCADDSVEEYRIPGNAPSGILVDLMVLLREVDAAEADDLGLIADLRSQIQEKSDDLFLLRNSTYEPGDVKLSDPELGALVAGMFRQYYGVDAEGGDRPTVPEEEPETPAATPPKPRSGQRSGKSSRAARAPARSRSSTSSPT